jgi:hypothetical protein
MKKLILAAALAVLASSANATVDFCAVVRETPDGFLALREGPGTQFPVVHKLRRGDFLYADDASCERGVCANRNRWTHVLSVPRLDGPPNNPNKAHGSFTSGWVASRYIEWFVCPEDQAAGD